MLALFTSGALAFMLGLRHATEPDHVAAVATLVPEQRDANRAMQLGAAWGVGHCLAILACGSALLLLRTNMSARVSDWLELTVSALLLILGTRSLLRAVRTKQGAGRAHSAAETEHVHDHVRSRRKSLLIGLLHGVAGSGSLAALVFANMPSLRAGLAYLACFGTGSLFGMAALAGLAGAPLRVLTRRENTHALLFACAGLLSLSIGLHCGLPIARRLLGA
jgi:high-affinity nickel-transport protein